MDRSLYLASGKAAPALCLRIISAMYYRDIAVCICLIAYTFYEICLHQAHFIPREQTEVFFRRLNHKIVTLNIKFSAKRNLSFAESFVFQIILCLQPFCLTFGIIVNHKPDRVKDRHHTRLLQLQVFADTVLKHGIIHRTLSFGHSAEIYKHFQGFRGKSTPSQSSDGHKTRIVPAVYHSVLHQLLNIPLSCHHIRQVHFRKFNLPGRRIKLTFPDYPVIKGPVILKFQRTDRMRDLLHRILDGMCKIVHRVDAPFITGIMVGHMRYTVDDRIAHIDIRGCHVNPGAEHFLSILVFSFLHLLKQTQILFHGSVTIGAVFSGLFQRTSVFTDLVCAQVTDKSLSFFDQLDGTLIHHVKVIGSKIQMFFIVGAQPFHVSFDGLYKFCILLRRIRIVKPQVEGSVIFLCQP